MGEEATGRAAAAKEWLEGIVAGSRSASGDAVCPGSFFSCVSVSGLGVSGCIAGRVLCTFRVPPHLDDGEGNWQPGAIAAAIDLLGAAVNMATEGVVKVTVEFDVAFFSQGKIGEEVEIDARAVQSKGRLTAVRVEVRKRGGRQQLVAVGRLWTVAGRPLGFTGGGRSSKL